MERKDNWQPGTGNDPLLGSGNEPMLTLAQKVAQVHEAHRPELRELAALVELVIFSPSSASETRRYWSSIRRMTSDFTPPADACKSYRALFRELERTEASVLARLSRAEDSQGGKDLRAADATGTGTSHDDTCCGV